MKQDGNTGKALEQAWRKPLTPAELNTLGLDREAQTDISSESALTAALNRLPEAPVSSNFTRRVLDAARLEQAARERRRRPAAIFFGWLPRVAAVCAVVVITLVAHEKVEQKRVREMARSVAIISAPSLSPEILKDFDAIQVMSRTPSADEQLLALME